MNRNKSTIWIWFGGVTGVLTMGMLRFLGKLTNIYGLLTGMLIIAAGLSFIVIRYINKKW